MVQSLKFVILAVAMLALVACGLIRLEGETPHLDQIEGADAQVYITKYVECVNSRFPDPSSGYRATTEDAVARELLADRLDMAGMDVTYSSLGCGTLRPTEDTATEDTTGPHFPKQHDGVKLQRVSVAHHAGRSGRGAVADRAHGLRGIDIHLSPNPVGNPAVRPGADADALGAGDVRVRLYRRGQHHILEHRGRSVRVQGIRGANGKLIR